MKRHLLGFFWQAMKQKLKEFAMAPEHRQSDSCVVVIMSHGYQSPGQDPEGSWRPLRQQPPFTYRPCPYVVHSSDGRALEVEWIIQQFSTVRALQGKPKLFIIQACRYWYRYSESILASKWEKYINVTLSSNFLQGKRTAANKGAKWQFGRVWRKSVWRGVPGCL